MTNLKKLEAIRSKFEKETGKRLTHKMISDIMGKRSVYTVAHWFDKSQSRPIPDDTLELLELKVDKAIQEEVAA
jgi:hypothetical protein